MVLDIAVTCGACRALEPCQGAGGMSRIFRGFPNTAVKPGTGF